MSTPPRRPTPIPVPAHLLDHRILGRAVLPAAHALCLLAEAVRQETGRTCPVSREAVFQGFLPLPDPPEPIPAFVSMGPREADGGLPVSLLTRFAARDGSVSRAKEHLRARFCPSDPAALSLPPEISSPSSRGPGFPVDRESVYRDLVPFGPAFRNCAGPVLLWPEEVSAEILAPPATAAENEVLGSPFVFDAALHAVNVWVQRYRGIVVFPVGYTARHVEEPTRAGRRYVCRAVPRTSPDPSPTFDLWILDPEGRVCEAVLGVRMRELFPGKLRPPAWILA